MLNCLSIGISSTHYDLCGDRPARLLLSRRETSWSPKFDSHMQTHAYKDIRARRLFRSYSPYRSWQTSSRINGTKIIRTMSRARIELATFSVLDWRDSHYTIETAYYHARRTLSVQVTMFQSSFVSCLLTFKSYTKVSEAEIARSSSLLRVPRPPTLSLVLAAAVQYHDWHDDIEIYIIVS